MVAVSPVGNCSVCIQVVVLVVSSLVHFNKYKIKLYSYILFQGPLKF